MYRITVTYRPKEKKEEFPYDEELDKKLTRAMESVGARSTGSGSGCGGRDLEFDLED